MYHLNLRKWYRCTTRMNTLEIQSCSPWNARVIVLFSYPSKWAACNFLCELLKPYCIWLYLASAVQDSSPSKLLWIIGQIGHLKMLLITFHCMCTIKIYVFRPFPNQFVRVIAVGVNVKYIKFKISLSTSL